MKAIKITEETFESVSITTLKTILTHSLCQFHITFYEF